MRDQAHLQVLEAVLVMMLLVGTLLATIALREPAPDRLSTLSSTTRMTEDALAILDGIGNADGPLLLLGLQEALHCSLDPHPPPGPCPGGRGRNLSQKLDAYFPDGSRTMLGLGNGVDTREIWRDEAPPGEAVSARRGIDGSWNLTFVALELSCLEPGMDANVTLVPIRGGNLTSPLVVGAKYATDSLVAAERAATYGLWNATIPGAGRPAVGTVAAKVTAPRPETFQGSTAFASCDLAGAGLALHDAVRSSSLHVPAAVPVGSDAVLVLHSGPLGLLGTLGDARIDIYAPLAARDERPDAYARVATLPVPSGGGAAVWPVPPDSLYGAHAVVARQALLVPDSSGGETAVEARLVGVVHVALPDGTVPSHAPYQAVVQVWFPDWR